MNLIVLIMAVIIVSVSLSTVIMPEAFKAMLSRLVDSRWLWPASLFRLVLGILFYLAADNTVNPVFIRIVATVLIVASISLPVIGQNRLNELMKKLLSRKDWQWRIAAFVALLFGISLAMAGFPVS